MVRIAIEIRVLPSKSQKTAWGSRKITGFARRPIVILTIGIPSFQRVDQIVKEPVTYLEATCTKNPHLGLAVLNNRVTVMKRIRNFIGSSFFFVPTPSVSPSNPARLKSD